MSINVSHFKSDLLIFFLASKCIFVDNFINKEKVCVYKISDYREVGVTLYQVDVSVGTFKMAASSSKDLRISVVILYENKQ